MDNKKYMFQYETVYTNDFGRYLIAKCDIPEKSLILVEKPLVVAPADEVRDRIEGQTFLCMGCCAPLSLSNKSDKILYKCSSCRWPMCNRNCEKMTIHSKNECAVFKRNKIGFPPPQCWPVLNKTILVLRCLLMKKTNPTAWAEFFKKLEHHSETRREKYGCRKGDEMIIENFEYFYKNWDKCPFTKDDILMTSGVINVNAFCAVKTDESSGVTRRAKCLFEQASLLAHSCSPNCSWDIDITTSNINNLGKENPVTIEIQVQTAVPIPKGEMLTILYSARFALFGTLKRIVSIEEIAHFVCKCSRCRDPTEFGSYTSAVKCYECEADYLLPEDPTEPESNWKCIDSNCARTYNVCKVVYTVSKVEDHFETIKSLELAPKDELRKLQDIYDKYSKEPLHQNHYIIQEISTRILQILVEDMNILIEDKDHSAEIYVPFIEMCIFHCNYLLEIARVLLQAMTSYIDTLESYLDKAEKIKMKNI